MKLRARLALGGAAVWFALPARAGEVRAFSNLDFGDSRISVASKVRENLDEGLFRRDCYKCSIRVAIGRYGFDLAPEFSDSRLWRISLRHALPPGGSQRTEALKEAWGVLRTVIVTRYPEPRLASADFPELPSPPEARNDIDIVTDTWVEDSKRLDLVVSVTVEQRITRRSLREGIFARWFFGESPREEKVVTYAVEVRITSTEIDAPSGGIGDRKAAEPEEIERASQLF
ncbi:MAG: hypothetical protein ACE5FL_05550 [Myxococcota bacterium]